MTVRIRVDYELASGPRSAFATTLGAGGLFIECEDPPPANAVLTLRFRLPTAPDPFVLKGRVTWRRTAETDGLGTIPGMGVQFAQGGTTGLLARALDQMNVPEEEGAQRAATKPQP